uniref:Protein LLP homolog n=1 Tax=Clastoptera arizonana TaxID=38151 RepID=A0A1B6DT42_9HEMI
MAKSLRSKWKRKMRAVKRERYGKKELDRLKLVLGVKDLVEDVTMKNSDNEVTIVPNEADENKSSDVQTEKTEVKVEQMDDGRRIYSRKTMRDQFGQYPIWLSSNKVKNLVKKNKTLKRQKKKKAGKIAKRSKR